MPNDTSKNPTVLNLGGSNSEKGTRNDKNTWIIYLAWHTYICQFFQNTIAFYHSFHYRCNNFVWNWCNRMNLLSALWILMTWARFLSLARSKLRLCSANHRTGYWSNLSCDWPSTAWAYSEQKTENEPWCFSAKASIAIMLSVHPFVSRCLRVNR